MSLNQEQLTWRSRKECQHSGERFCGAGLMADEDVLEQELAMELSQEAFHASAREGEELQDIDRCSLTCVIPFEAPGTRQYLLQPCFIAKASPHADNAAGRAKRIHDFCKVSHFFLAVQVLQLHALKGVFVE